MPMKKKLLFIH